MRNNIFIGILNWCILLIFLAEIEFSLAKYNIDDYTYDDSQEMDPFLLKPSGESCTVITEKMQAVGVCVHIKSCDVLSRMLREVRRRPEIGNFLRKLRCDPSRSAHVCCPKHSIKKQEKESKLFLTDFLSPPHCGQVNTSLHKVIGGEQAPEGAQPWMVSLWYLLFNHREPFFGCGGVLITNYHILTAAHCLKVKQSRILFKAVIGGDKWRTKNSGMDYYIKKVTIHPNYSERKKINDVGIITLRRTVQFSWDIKPICLPISNELLSETFARFPAFVAGWGATNRYGIGSSQQLLQAQLYVVNNEFCNKSYSKAGYKITRNQLCAYDEMNQKDTCQGDSGGPLISPYVDAYYVIGIVSFGYKCGEPGYPGVYTRVTSYLEWILSIIT